MNPIELFDKLTDPRSDHTKLYPLQTLVFLTISAVVSGCETFTEIEEFGRMKLDWLKKYVKCPDDRIPSHDTLGDFFKRLDPKEFQECFINWTSQVCGISQGELIAIDGKTLRRSYDTMDNKTAIHMISAWATANDLVLGQVKTAAKSNEITAIPSLLKMLEVKDAIISIDAMGCQKEIARQIVGQQANYILALKGNQPELYEQVKAHFGYTIADSADVQINKDHGRIEKRKCTVINNLGLLDEAENWPEIQSVIKIEASRENLSDKKVTHQVRYYISSVKKSAQEFNRLIQSHWNIENKLHWVLDVNFNEDQSRLRKGYGDENFAIIRRIALNLIKLEKSKKPSQRIKRSKAGWSDEFRETVLKI
jgi:predicted transposase YbfD/YdcC